MNQIKLSEISQETSNRIIEGLLICLEYHRFGLFDRWIRKEIKKYLESFLSYDQQ